MRIFYKSYIESVLSFSMICWYGNLNVKDKASLAKVVKAAGKIIGAKQSSLADLYNRFVHKKAESILSANGHPLHPEEDVTYEVKTISCYLLSHVSDSLQLKPIDIDSHLFPVPFLY